MPTIRCLTEDLGLALPWLDTDLGDLEDPWLGELRRIAPVSPQGQKRVLSIGSPLVYWLRFSAERGVTWVDEEHGVVWLCAVHRRQEGSGDDAHTWFAKLHADGKLLPSGDDRLRDRAEAVIRLQRGLTAALLRLVDAALSRKGTELSADLGSYLPCPVLVRGNGQVEEIWCALSVRAADGTHIRDELRDILSATLEAHFPDAVRGAKRLARGPGELVGGDQAGLALTSGRLPGDPPDVLCGHIQEMRGDGYVTAGERQPGPLDALLDHVRVPGRVLCDSAVHDLGLRHVGERGEIADALLCLPAHFDRRLASHQTQSLPGT